MPEIKIQLKVDLEQIGRNEYKRILFETSKLKNKHSRNKSDNNVMIPVDILEDCIPKNQRVDI